MIKLSHIYKNFGSNEVLRDISLEVGSGEKLVIIGPSGSGKSTTVRCMNFLERPTKVEVYIDGVMMNGKNRISLLRNSSAMVGVPAVQPVSTYGCLVLSVVYNIVNRNAP